MTLSNLIKLKTNDGETVIDFLIDVMHDHYEDFQICHRLQAARLLTTYGNEDAPYFIDDNPKDPSSSARNGRKPKRPTKFDTELARLIKEDTSDGRSIARFLINVMEGELKSFKPHHRISAARELLNRGFGKSAHPPVVPAEAGTQRMQGQEPLTPNQTPSPEAEGQGESLPRTRSGGENPAPTHPEPVEGPNPPTNKIREIPESDESEFRHPPVVPAKAGTQRMQGQEALTPHSPPLTPGPKALLHTLTHLPPAHFEQTVLDLLEAIGYGQAQHLGRTGDGGIDGIINQDPLGLDRIYVQAKRWTKPVGEPEVRTFSGSLDPHGATRGVLITTSKFTRTARRTAETISTGNKHIRLVDGQELTQLMTSLNMGGETATPHRTRKQEEDHPAQHT